MIPHSVVIAKIASQIACNAIVVKVERNFLQHLYSESHCFYNSHMILYELLADLWNSPSESAAKSVGTLPVNKLEDTSNVSKRVSFARSLGMVPSR